MLPTPYTTPRKWNPQHAKVVKKEPAESGAGTATDPVIVLAQEKTLNTFDLPHAWDSTRRDPLLGRSSWLTVVI